MRAKKKCYLVRKRHSRNKKTCSILLNKELHKGIKGKQISVAQI